ncbi:MAG: DinB family protein, partial [Pedobacter sp.]|nr:DinB family protein [Pedobacter sp.]
MVDLITELEKSFDGDAWHGNNVMAQLKSADAGKVFARHIPNAHTIAELVLHLTAWTEEVTERIEGRNAKEPVRGDWPAPTAHSDQEWQLMVNDFKKANDKLIATLKNLNLTDWSRAVKDDREFGENESINYAQLINGLIQHHAYHSGQIALL